MEKRYWFKSKTYGYGWTPASPQGWAVTFGFGLGMAIYPWLARLGYVEFSLSDFLGASIPLTLAFLFLCYKKGEKPKWNWGKKP